MKVSRDYLVKYMSEIFNDIPDVIIADILDHLVTERVRLSKGSKGSDSHGISVLDTSYDEGLLQVCEDLYEKLAEISSKSFDKDVNNYGYLSSDFSQQASNQSLNFSVDKPSFSDIPNDCFNMSYLSACLRSGLVLNTGGDCNSVCYERNMPPGRIQASELEERPWDILEMQNGKLLGSEMEMLREIIGQIFNSVKLFRVKESKCRIWPPEGPGKETMTIPLRNIKAEYQDSGESNLNSLCVLRNKIQDLNSRLDQECSQHKRILATSKVTEYVSIKTQEFRDKTEIIKSEKRLLQKEYFNLLFNTQNSGFIDFILGKEAPRSKNQTNPAYF